MGDPTLYIRDEATRSSRIEGTQATLADVVAAEVARLHDDLPVHVRIGLLRAQFETIHPFIDGNGRVGRLLITFLLTGWGVLRHPLLYLSGFLRRHVDEYYRRLQSIRDDGDREGWLAFFLTEVTGRPRKQRWLCGEHLSLFRPSDR